MSTNNFFKSNLMKVHNVVQASMLVYPKEMIIGVIRDFFSQDDYYHYEKDQFGYANTTDHTDLPPGADIPMGGTGSTATTNVLLPTRLFVGENYRYNGIYYPAILVKSGGSKYVPISINRDQEGVQYSDIIYEDGYGNQTIVSQPVAFVTAGVWEGTIIIDVMTRSLRSRDDLLEALGMCFAEINFDTLHDVGIIVKPPTIGSPSETDDRNDKLFRQSITLEIRTEWRREIPINTYIDTIFFTAQFGNISGPEPILDPNLTINAEISLTDMILNM